MHHVLHLLDAPGAAVAAAARLLRPGDACWSPTSPRTTSSVSADSTAIACLGIADNEMLAGPLRPGWIENSSGRCRRPNPDEQLTVRLWLLRALASAGVAGAGTGGGLMPEISFEVFPPRTPEGEARLQQTLDRLAAVGPGLRLGDLRRRRQRHRTPRSMCSGAVARRGDVPVAGHLTCVGRHAHGDRCRDHALLACRGSPHCRPAWRRCRGPALASSRIRNGYASAVELVAAIRRMAPIEVSVAAYPEPHPDSTSVLQDLAVLAAQGRRRRDPRDHAVLFRHRRDREAARPDQRRWYASSTVVPGSCWRPTSPAWSGWHSAAAPASQAGSANALPALRTICPTRKLVGGDRRRRAGRPPSPRGLRRVPLLHAQPERAGTGGLPAAGRSAGA